MKKITILFLIVSATIFAQDGSLDNSFGTNGSYVLNGNTVDFNQILQPDGKILYRIGTMIYRLSNNGTPDLTFGSAGAITIAQPGTDFYTYIDLPSISKIAVFSSSTNLSTVTYYMGRYNYDGSIDTSFGTAGAGYKTIDGRSAKSALSPMKYDNATFLLGGSSISNTSPYANIVINKYDFNGTLDYSFNSSLSSGFNISSSSQGYSTDDFFRGMLLKNSGQLVANYQVRYYATTGFESDQAGYLTQTPSVTYPVTNTVSFTCYHGSIKSAMALDPGDNVVFLTGSNYNSSNTYAPTNYIYKASGNITPAFIVTGLGTAYFKKIAVQLDGKILLAGETTTAAGTNTRLILARYSSAGVLDTTFGANGYVLFDIPGATANKNTLSRLILTPSNDAIYLIGYNNEKSIIIKYSNSSLSLTSNAVESLKVYPNPIKEVLDLSFDKEISTVSIYNLLGQEVLTKVINANEGAIDTSNLASGTYMVKVTSNNEVKIMKVIKE